MTSTLVAPTTSAPHIRSLDNDEAQSMRLSFKGQDLIADFNYYKDPGDGSAPPPSIVGKPETFKTPTETRSMTVHDIRRNDDKHTLDRSGFQVLKHVSQEKTFEDAERIRNFYYPEIEDILKSA